MKKIFLIIIGVLIVLISVTLALQENQSSVAIPTYAPTEFPVSSSTVSVNYENFTKNPNAIEVGNGVYNINEAMTNPNLGFAFLYSESDDSIYISIDKEPLSQTREQASQYLLNLLDINQAVACTLKVYVGVPYVVSSTLTGQNLGLSFCPGSIKL